ncbi:hypothetical protein U9M48_034314 [Paspalum notatum var. saurae]|uniref:CBS domain-containing protein n=1 Tax=Paspalum notatum var. saurae TaxID=547442 RepID=A0AAQ3U8U6_PASNO
MAVRLLQTHEVSDLCIGKPALRWLPPSSTVADAVAELEGGGAPDAAVAVWDGAEGSAVVGRVRMPNVVLFLCADPNLASPAAALHATLSDMLLAAGAPPVRRIEPDARLAGGFHVSPVPLPGSPRAYLPRLYSSWFADPVVYLVQSLWVGSVLDAVDALLNGAHALVVPLRERWRRRGDLCWLTVEDVARFFLSSVGLFCPTASRSLSDLGVVRPPALAVAARDCALSVLPLLRAALSSHASVAVVVDDSTSHRRLLAGEISPSALCSCDVSVAAAVAALSAGHLVSFIDWGGAPPEATLHAVRSRLRRRNLLGMLDLLYCGNSEPSSSSSSSASSSSSSSSDEDEDGGTMGGKHRSLFSTRIVGRRPVADAIVCRRESSLVAVMLQATAHRATQVWVVGEEHELVGVVRLLDVLRVLRHHLHQPPV